MSSIEHISGTAGEVSVPGAPIMNFTLAIFIGPLINGKPPVGLVSGHIEIGQAVHPGHPIASSVTGQSYAVGGRQVIVFTGQYAVSLPPPAIGEIEQKISAVLVLESRTGGHGSFTYGGHSVVDVPVVLKH